MNRGAGILLSITSLPSKYGIGCFSKSAYDFVDWLKAAGQTCWQILPLGPTSYGDSPYQSFSTYAGNPYFIDLEALIEEGVLTREECEKADMGEEEGTIDYKKMYEGRYPLLRKAYERSNISQNPDYIRFMEENGWWLSDYALFMAVKGRFDGAPWTEWAQDIRLRWGYAMDYYRRELYFDIEFQQYLQFTFYKQWQALKDYANRQGVRIIGDIPIYVAMDSADAWAHPELFQLDQDNVPLAVAGCPPDGFSAVGQLWGNPLYRWDYHRQTGYDWWMKRLAHCFSLYDVVRIDHFRGFDEYYSIPYGAKSAIGGHWEKGPGMDLFRRMREVLGEKEVIAEDLGYVTDSVRQLVRDTGFPGMKVLEFAFDSRDSGCANDYLPHNYTENCVAYTGTHDNETIRGWFESIREDERRLARAYICDKYTPRQYLHTSFISLIMASRANLCVIPIQDYMGYDNTCRMNKPSTVGINWKWRLKSGELTEDLQKEIRAITRRYGRLGWQWDERLDG
ncbi:MAG TPA: 4-alpha-glucanotransferase [Candidatus Enterocloster excrementipullorum]|uniref:4-alpha-glucanotransferase n=1 Tax=Candidatus Enterocloster excrementipullorum TaxID=2838559 RepID=A0A9D2SI55_9FIRM|nr:4-alpha-glucanotransferase [Candidatus Enterocloster excrementipullorum]